MYRLTFPSIFLLACLSGCVTQPEPDPQYAVELDRVERRIDGMETRLVDAFVESCQNNISVLSDELKKLEIATQATKETTKVIERCTNNKQSVKAVENDKLVMGAVERVRLIKEATQFTAQIDTGADTSSVGVYDLQPFERDGKEWVRFALSDKNDAEEYEYPVHDTVKIRLSGALIEGRVEIKMDIQIGGKTYRKQVFNLSDRRKMDHQVMIGKSFIRDIAVVDVSQKFLLRSK